MIAAVVSAQNRCYYCITAHGAAVRSLSDDPALGELMVMNYRAARLDKRRRAMLDFAVKLTAEPWLIEEADRERLRNAGFSDRDIWDIAAVAAFYNMTNRLASATDMRPNSQYHGQTRMYVGGDRLSVRARNTLVPSRCGTTSSVRYGSRLPGEGRQSNHVTPCFW